MGAGPATGAPDAGGLIEQPLDFGPVDGAGDEPFDLRCGDVIEVLSAMDAQSVQTVITSPPYYGLRNYGIPGRVWDDPGECRHEWGHNLPSHHPGQVEQTKWKNANAAGAGQTMPSGQFCIRCSAWLGVLGQEPSLQLYLNHLVEVFRAVRRVLRPDGTVWLNLGDSYAGGGCHVEQVKYPGVDKPVRRRQRGGLTGKDLLMVPARAALALQADGWVLRSDIIWAKGVSFCPSYSGSVMPESTRDRPTWSHEHVFLLTKQESYYYDIDGCREAYAGDSRREAGGNDYRGRARKDYASAGAQNPSDVKRRVLDSIAGGTGRNLRNVWVIPKQNFAGLHFATFPEALVRPMIALATSAKGECEICGTPWERVVERSAIPAGVVEAFEASRAASAVDTGRTDGHTLRRPNHIRTVVGERWEAGCTCLVPGEFGDIPAPVRPQIVLDIFNGSGRTGIAAVKEGRRYVGIDINPSYIHIAQAAIWEAYRDRHSGIHPRGDDRGERGDRRPDQRRGRRVDAGGGRTIGVRATVGGVQEGVGSPTGPASLDPATLP